MVLIVLNWKKKKNRRNRKSNNIKCRVLIPKKLIIMLIKLVYLQKNMLKM